MSNKLTVKQRGFIKRFVENGGNGTQAAMDIYDVKNYNTAHSIASDNLQKGTIRKSIELALERAGLSEDYISELLREATVAGLGQKATNSDTLRGIEMMLKLKDAFPTQKTAHLRVDYQAEYRAKVERMSPKQVLGETDKQGKRLNDLMQDLNS